MKIKDCNVVEEKHTSKDKYFKNIKSIRNDSLQINNIDSIKSENKK
jgi:hypothetical protein